MKKHYIPLLVAFLVVLLASGCSVTAKKGGTAAAANTGFLGMKKADLDVATPKAFAGVRQVVIGSFKVTFIEAKKSSAKAGRGAGGVAAANVDLVGIDNALRQSITDDAYNHFLGLLQAHGYEVVERSRLLGSDQFKKAKALTSPHDPGSLIMAPGAKATVFVPSAFEGVTHVFMSDGMGGGGFAFSNSTLGAANFAQASGVRVLAVNCLLDFVNSDASGGAFSATSAVEVGQGLSVKPGSALSLLGGQGGSFQSVNGTITLGQPVYSTAEFAEVVDVTSDAFKGVQYATNAVTALLGGGTNITRKYEFRARPDAYRNIATGVLRDATGKLVDAMVARR